MEQGNHGHNAVIDHEELVEQQRGGRLLGPRDGRPASQSRQNPSNPANRPTRRPVNTPHVMPKRLDSVRTGQIVKHQHGKGDSDSSLKRRMDSATEEYYYNMLVLPALAEKDQHIQKLEADKHNLARDLEDSRTECEVLESQLLDLKARVKTVAKSANEGRDITVYLKRNAARLDQDIDNLTQFAHIQAKMNTGICKWNHI